MGVALANFARPIILHAGGLVHVYHIISTCHAYALAPLQASLRVLKLRRPIYLSAL